MASEGRQAKQPSVTQGSQPGLGCSDSLLQACEPNERNPVPFCCSKQLWSLNCFPPRKLHLPPVAYCLIGELLEQHESTFRFCRVRIHSAGGTSPSHANALTPDHPEMYLLAPVSPTQHSFFPPLSLEVWRLLVSTWWCVC